MSNIAQCLLVGADRGDASVFGTVLGLKIVDRVTSPKVARAKGPGVPEAGQVILSDGTSGVAEEAGTAALEALGLALENVSGTIYVFPIANLRAIAQIFGLAAAFLTGTCNDVGRTVFAFTITHLLGITDTLTAAADCARSFNSISCWAVIILAVAFIILQASHTSPMALASVS
jgi:hypothetical protein